MNTLEREDTRILDALDFSIHCGAPFHELGGKGCTPGTHATRLLVAPCCGPRLYLCETRARYLANVAAIIHCSRCGRDHPSTLWRFPPIDEG